MVPRVLSRVQGIVIAGCVRLCRLAAVAALAMQGRGFHGFEDQVQPQAAVLGQQVKFFPLKLRLPVVDPDLQVPAAAPDRPKAPRPAFSLKAKVRRAGSVRARWAK